MRHHKLFWFFAILVICITVCAVTHAQAESDCVKALRLHIEIAPVMKKFIEAQNLPPGRERTKAMNEFIFSGTALKFFEEFCPALIDCGYLPGFDQEASDLLIDICGSRK